MPAPSKISHPDNFCKTGQGAWLASAAGLQAEAPLALVRQLAHYAQGSSPYQVDVTARGGAPEVLVRSDLQGLALQLPAPLDKDSAQRLPLMVRSTPQGGGTSQLDIVVQGRGQLRYQLGSDGQAQGGAIALGADVPLPPPSTTAAPTVAAVVRLPALDIDAWSQVLDTLEGSHDTSASYLPQRVQLDVGSLRFQL